MNTCLVYDVSDGRKLDYQILHPATNRDQFKYRRGNRHEYVQEYEDELSDDEQRDAYPHQYTYPYQWGRGIGLDVDEEDDEDLPLPPIREILGDMLGLPIPPEYIRPHKDCWDCKAAERERREMMMQEMGKEMGSARGFDEVDGAEGEEGVHGENREDGGDNGDEVHTEKQTLAEANNETAFVARRDGDDEMNEEELLNIKSQHTQIRIPISSLMNPLVPVPGLAEVSMC